MNFNKLGKTDIKVSEICLGTMTWGEQNTIEEAHEQLDCALDYGVNFIDTAEMYPVAPKEDTYSLTEQYIGKWEKLRTNRDKIILATKVAGPSENMDPYIRKTSDRQTPFSKSDIKSACELSLKRLGVDYIDLYQLHWPTRVTNFFGQLGYTHVTEEIEVSFEERIEAMEELIKEGKIRHWGLSNETPWGVSEYLRLTHGNKNLKPVSIQNPYSVLNRSYEVGLAEMSIREDIGLLAYSPLGFGVLSGKYLDGKKPEGARLTISDRFTRYLGEHAESATRQYIELADKVGLAPSVLALAFVNNQNFVTSTIIGATKMSQLKENLTSSEIVLDKETMQRIEEIHATYTIPCP